jgi:uncharacterized damage-inducible protein DinB
MAMNQVLLELFRHNTWATLGLIEYCQGLSDDLLDATIPGTYGSIRETLRHLVRAEESYYWTVTRERFAEILPEQGPVALAELAERIRGLGPHWETLIQDEDLPSRETTTRDGWRVPAAVPMAQCVHHADTHRTHVLSLLGARGVEVPEYPDLSVWDHAISTGSMREPSASTGG